MNFYAIHEYANPTGKPVGIGTSKNYAWQCARKWRNDSSISDENYACLEISEEEFNEIVQDILAY